MREPTDRPQWWTARAVAIHLALLLVLPMCGIAAWWQVHRALSGNFLSWLYVFEWPAFGGIAVWLWWVLLTVRGTSHEASVSEPANRILALQSPPLRWDPEAESPELTAFNAFLADLNAGKAVSRPKTPIPWRRWMGRPWNPEASRT